VIDYGHSRIYTSRTVDRLGKVKRAGRDASGTGLGRHRSR